MGGDTNRCRYVLAVSAAEVQLKRSRAARAQSSNMPAGGSRCAGRRLIAINIVVFGRHFGGCRTGVIVALFELRAHVFYVDKLYSKNVHRESCLLSKFGRKISLFKKYFPNKQIPNEIEQLEMEVKKNRKNNGAFWQKSLLR